MSEELKEIKNEECFCKNKYFRNFLTTTAGVFVGGFLALSLFGAINKPPMPAFPMHPPVFHHYTPQFPIMKHCDCPCHKKMKMFHEFKKGEFKKGEFKRPPFNPQKPDKKPEKNND